MSEQKMREALEQIKALTEIPFAHTAGDHELIYQIATEALAPPAAPVVPEGYVLVPKELIETARRACGEPHPHRPGDKLILTVHVEALEDALDALAAAPQPQQEAP